MQTQLFSFISSIISSWEFILSGILSLLFVIVFTIEVIAPASKNKCDKRWFILSLGLNGLTSIVSIGLGYFLASKYNGYSIFQTKGVFSDITIALIGFLIASFVFYWWHRATHHFDFLWRSIHQLHHSAKRIESLTAFYAHPFDVASTVILNFSICHFILGASPFAYFLELLLAGIFSLLTHADIKTPYWFGYFIQRPEMHTIHHQKDVHAFNYTGLPLWDLLFGTWKNPKTRIQEVGFDDEKSAMVFEMLMCQDVHQQK